MIDDRREIQIALRNISYGKYFADMALNGTAAKLAAHARLLSGQLLVRLEVWKRAVTI